MSVGMNAATGRSLSGIDHLRQSIGKILTTPVGSRIKRRDFGSMLPELLDQPMNERTALQLFAATATALYRHEPRFRLTRVQLDTSAARRGAASLVLSGVAVLNGDARPATLDVPLTAGA